MAWERRETPQHNTTQHSTTQHKRAPHLVPSIPRRSTPTYLSSAASPPELELAMVLSVNHPARAIARVPLPLPLPLVLPTAMLGHFAKKPERNMTWLGSDTWHSSTAPWVCLSVRHGKVKLQASTVLYCTVPDPDPDPPRLVRHQPATHFPWSQELSRLSVCLSVCSLMLALRIRTYTYIHTCILSPTSSPSPRSRGYALPIPMPIPMPIIEPQHKRPPATKPVSLPLLLGTVQQGEAWRVDAEMLNPVALGGEGRAVSRRG